MDDELCWKEALLFGGSYHKHDDALLFLRGGEETEYRTTKTNCRLNCDFSSSQYIGFLNDDIGVLWVPYNIIFRQYPTSSCVYMYSHSLPSSLLNVCSPPYLLIYGAFISQRMAVLFCHLGVPADPQHFMVASNVVANTK